MQGIEAAERLMESFAERTGIADGGDRRRRYLWTDACAIEAFLGLHRRTGVRLHLDRAIRTAELVHRVLGRHRPDDERTGWISGLDEAAGALRPTAGGLRIGKPLPERARGAPHDERLEWDRDGQYFHYLTKWMHALHALGNATRNASWNRLAADLAHGTCAAFVHEPFVGGTKRIHWKMSIDRSRPLVRSMGHLDPLDGYVALAEVQASLDAHDPAWSFLQVHAADLMRICREVPAWTTVDPLSLGGLISETSRLACLVAAGRHPNEPILERLAHDARRSLEAFGGTHLLERSIETRLAFRELGLAIGLQAVVAAHEAVRHHRERFGDPWGASALLAHLESMVPHTSLIARIEETWLDPDAQETSAWQAHLDINAVMLALSLVSSVVPVPGAAAGIGLGLRSAQ
jgi:hypothetical protein